MPRINNKKYLQVDFKLDISDLAGYNPTGGINITKRKLKQDINVRDEQTIFVTGIRQTKEYQSSKKVPVLSDIPILGLFFRTIQKEVAESILTIFITPHIIDSANELIDLYKKNSRELKELAVSISGEKIINNKELKILMK